MADGTIGGVRAGAESLITCEGGEVMLSILRIAGVLACVRVCVCVCVCVCVREGRPGQHRY